MQSGAGQESVTLKGEDSVREVVEVALKWKVVSVAILLAVRDTECWGGGGPGVLNGVARADLRSI